VYWQQAPIAKYALKSGSEEVIARVGQKQHISSISFEWNTALIRVFAVLRRNERMAQKDGMARRGKSKDKSGKALKKRSPSIRSNASPVEKKAGARGKKGAKIKIPPWLSQTKGDFEVANKEISDKIITKKPPAATIDITPHYLLSQRTLPNYVTLDWQHRTDIQELEKTIGEYAQDKTTKRPLNVMLRAGPGSGKSHFIESLAQDMHSHNIRPVTFNMTCMESMSDLVQPLEEVRNAKVNDQLPLLFLDEFDCRDNNYPLLLPLLWDGELKVGQRDLKVGKIVIILAGSKPELQDTVKAIKKMKKEIGNVPDKLPDLLSRINAGEIEIPGLDEESGDRNRKVDKVCLSIALLERRFEKQLDRLPWALLSFIAHTNFRYGVRSIAHLVSAIPADSLKTNTISMRDLKLPFDRVQDLRKSNLAYHIFGGHGASEVVALWNDLAQNDASVVFRSEQEFYADYYGQDWNVIVDYFDSRRTSAPKE